ncbi:MAG: bifunctional hydroxymethylpyrimidine kinase/phosphomethylpyrimidine kinase [Acidobacteriota bacterium]
MTWPVSLTIAGSDPSGGAGIQADLKSFAAHEVYGCSVLTVITAQNTAGIQEVHPLPPELVATQIRAVVDDLPVAAVKIGALGSAGIVRVVGEALARLAPLPVVVDPVIESSSGRRLLDDAGMAALLERVLPQATLLTPNRHEASVLTGLPGRSGRAQARALLEAGAGAVMITGGDDADEEVSDLFFDGHRSFDIRRPRISTTSTHGTGCTLSAAIAARLALGDPLVAAVEAGRDYVQRCLETSWPVGSGRGPLNHFHRWWGRGA